MRQYWVAPIPPMHVLDGAAFNTFTAFQDISPAPAVKLPPNTLEVGVTLEMEAWGEFSNTATPTLSIGFFFGTAAVVLGQTTLITTTTGATSWLWQAWYKGRVRVIGAAGSIVGSGHLSLGTSLTAMTDSFIPATLALRTVAIDTSIEKVVGVGAQWGTSSVSNTIKVNQLDVTLRS